MVNRVAFINNFLIYMVKISFFLKKKAIFKN